MTTAPDLSLLLYGWAPGDCTPKCFDCSGRHHNSDKRSMRCRPCAEKVRDDHTAGKGGAIAAQERERCAVMAETHEWFVGGIGTVAPGSGQAKAIAAAIRAVAPLTTAAEPEQCHGIAPTIAEIERAICCPSGTCTSPTACYAEDPTRSYPVQIQDAAKAVTKLYRNT